MEQQRFVESRGNSFFGEFLYCQVVPQNHFLRQLKEIIGWDRFTKKLIRLYKGAGVVGRPPFDPAQVLRVEIIAYLYKLTERQVEVYINENLPAKYFVGLAVDQPAPDHSTLTVFRERLLKRGKIEVFEEMLEEIVQIALQSGIQFGSIQIVDSVHSIANVNTDKDQKQQKKGKGPRDPDAQWGVKHTRKVKTQDGKEEEQREYFYGYKAHVSLNAHNGLITSLEVTSGEAYDGHHFCSLVDHDLKQKLPVDTYSGDRGYDDGDNHYYLEMRGLHSAIRLKKNRIEKKDDNKEIWLELVKSPQYQQGLKERYKIERKFGEAKQGHGLGRCRYVGKACFAIQVFFTAIILNLKRMVKILTGIGFKTSVASPA
jgi:IS5 family transposase